MILDVLIEGRLAGRVELRGRGVASLRYEASYVHGDRATPLSTLFPLDDVLVHSGEGVHDWLMGLLPDDERVLGSWHAKHGVEMSRPLELLGTEIGVECAGAAQFCSPERTAGLLERIGGVHPMSDDRCSSVCCGCGRIRRTGLRDMIPPAGRASPASSPRSGCEAPLTGGHCRGVRNRRRTS